MDRKGELEVKSSAKGVAPAIGIDLGTTYSCVGFWQHGQVQIIPNDLGNRTTPSCVAFTDVERLIGEGAKNQVAMNPACTIFGMYFVYTKIIFLLVRISIRMDRYKIDSRA
ncbi:putative Heat shock protein 70 family [Helianthus annuus]|nr:putative Heat shock protein 70 family [Helianthus annuus]KAJ0782346.1 putative Heat shock protein 70 family [Helianthus annuus]KAJ0946903.1 putative Heat shock protein 70 family [Helianthus annuus]KAJ0955933.1 putative Heat shock protein 70 family [Helianthus annuus]